MSASEHVSEQFKGHSDPNVHWSENWANNLREANVRADDSRSHISGSVFDSPINQWVNSSWHQPARFPTNALQHLDSRLAEYGHLEHWDSNPETARRQATIRKRPDVQRMDVNAEHPEHLHEQMKGTGVPEHVTVYHHGDIPRNAEYASGSVDPKWPEEVKSGWRSKDPSINRGRLHIYLVPHQDILHGGSGAEDEVFFRRGQSFNKTKRSQKQQRIVATNLEDRMEYGG
jgi:hypothetical protein